MWYFVYRGKHLEKQNGHMNIYPKELDSFFLYNDVIRQKKDIKPNVEHIKVDDIDYEIPVGDGTSFGGVLLRLIDASNKKDSDIYKKAGISRQLFSKIRSDYSYHPRKETVFALCLALQLGEEFSRILVYLSGYSFSFSYTFDNIVLFCLKNNIYNPIIVNTLLMKKGLPV